MGTVRGQWLTRRPSKFSDAPSNKDQAHRAFERCHLAVDRSPLLDEPAVIPVPEPDNAVAVARNDEFALADRAERATLY